MIATMASAFLMNFMLSLLNAVIKRRGIPVSENAPTGRKFIILFREKKGHVKFVRPFGRDLIGVVVRIVSDLTEQVDRLITKLRDFSKPAAYRVGPLLGSIVVGLRDIRCSQIPAFIKVLGEDRLNADCAYMVTIGILTVERKTCPWRISNPRTKSAA
jgi:hypothetical protein